MFDGKFLEELKRRQKDWMENRVKKALSKAPERKKEFKTFSGIPIKPFYTPDDIRNIDFFKDISFPGEYPYTTGIYPLMYRTRLYTMRQYAGFGTAEETNKMFKFLLKHGETGLNIAFDLPTQLGYDPDHPLAKGEVGKVGVSVSNKKEYEILYDGIPMDTISVNIQANANAPFMMGMHIAEAARRGVPQEKLWGSCQNEVLKEAIARGAYIYPIEHSMKLACDVVEYCVKYLPRWQPVSPCPYHIQEAGANFVTALAFSFSIALAYVEAMLKRGLPIDSFAFYIPVWNFVFGPDFFETICGLRALRRLWARTMKERYNAKNPRSYMVRIFGGSGGVRFSRFEPLNNVVRATISTVAAALGGVQAMGIQCYDEAYSIPTEESLRLALRTMQIVAYETGICDVVDPLAGSYYVEYLTNEIEKEVKRIVQEVDDMGGAVEAIKKGYFQRVIAQQAYEYHKKLEEGEIPWVGENIFVAEKPEELKSFFEVRPGVEEEVIERLKRFKASRDEKVVEESLSKLRKAAEKNENTMPYIIEAVKAGATVGEMAETLAEIFGREKEIPVY